MGGAGGGSGKPAARPGVRVEEEERGYGGDNKGDGDDIEDDGDGDVEDEDGRVKKIRG